MRPLPILTAALLLAVSSCKKDDPSASLPPATHEGRNTGGCLINGQPFVATGWGSYSILGPGPIPPLSGGFYEDSLYYLELAGTQGGSNVEITLFLRSRRPGLYLLNQNTPTLNRAGLRATLAYAAYHVQNSADEYYVTDAQRTGNAVLTQSNLSSGISAGTFEFTAASTLDRRKTITITNGRFDRQQ